MKNTLLPCLLLLTFHPLPAQVPYTYVVQVLPGLQSGSISVSHSPLDNETIENAFDGNANSLARSASRTFRVMLAKITADGQQTFLKELETGLPAIGFKIVAAGDGNLFIAGYSDRPGQENSDLLVLIGPHAGWECAERACLRRLSDEVQRSRCQRCRKECRSDAFYVVPQSVHRIYLSENRRTLPIQSAHD